MEVSVVFLAFLAGLCNAQVGRNNWFDFGDNGDDHYTDYEDSSVTAHSKETTIVSSEPRKKETTYFSTFSDNSRKTTNKISIFSFITEATTPQRRTTTASPSGSPSSPASPSGSPSSPASPSGSPSSPDASSIPTTTFPDTPTEAPLTTWVINTTVPETTTVPTPAPHPNPFIAPFNTSCIAAATIYGGADTEERSDLIFYQPPSSMVNGTCSDTEDVINLNQTWYAPEYNNRAMEIYLSLYFKKTAQNTYKMEKLVFLIPDDNNEYEEYIAEDIPYMVDIPIGQSYQCNFTNKFEMRHSNASRQPLTFTFRSVWIEAFRTDLYQPLGAPKACESASDFNTYLTIAVGIIVSIVVLSIVIAVIKFRGREVLHRTRAYLQGYGILEGERRHRSFSEQLEQAFIEDAQTGNVQYTERSDNTGISVERTSAEGRKPEECLKEEVSSKEASPAKEEVSSKEASPAKEEVSSKEASPARE